MCKTIENIPAHYSDECAEGGTGIGCDGGCACMRGCDCPCHSLHAPLFQNNEEVAEWHAPITLDEPKQYRLLDATDTSAWTVEDHLDWMRTYAQQARYMNEVAFNVKVTTMTYYMGLRGYHTTDLTVTTHKYREMGVIK